MDGIVGISIIPENDLKMGKEEARILCVAISDGIKQISFRSVGELFNFIGMKENKIKRIVSSDLRRDGEFILAYMLQDEFVPVVRKEFEIENEKLPEWARDRWRWGHKEELRDKNFSTYISSRGIWYDIVFRFKKRIFEIIDLSKMCPGGLEQLSENFLGEKINDFSPNDICTSGNYDNNSAEVRAKAIIDIYKLAKKSGMEKDTIGMNCLSGFVSTLPNGWKSFKNRYPNLYEVKIDSHVAKNAGDYVRLAYGGGFLYLPEEFENKKIEDGFIIDVSSLYTSRMHSKSFEIYPQGLPRYGAGKWNAQRGFIGFQAIYCEFQLKEGMLPFIKIQNSYLYPRGKNLERSSYKCNGEWRRNRIVMVFEWKELQLFFKHYDVFYLEYIDYLEFVGTCGIYDEYINEWWEKKLHAENKSERFIAKLYQNNLPGKFASAREGEFRVPRLDESGTLFFDDKLSLNPNPGYIAVGATCLANTRRFQIENCQRVHEDGKFLYSDTDCIFGSGEIPKYLEVANDILGAYKIEGYFEWCYFQKQKRYIAKMKNGEGDIISRTGNTFKFSCAGLSERGKALFLASIGEPPYGIKNLTNLEKEFIGNIREVEDFTEGISIPGQRIAKRVKGGIVYEESTFTILGRDSIGIL